MDDNIDHQFSQRGLNKYLNINEPVRSGAFNLNTSSAAKLKI